MGSLAAVEVLDHELVEQLLRLTTRTGQLLHGWIVDRKALKLPGKSCFNEQFLVILAPERQVIREHPRQTREEGVTDVVRTLGEGYGSQTETLIQQLEVGADVAAEDVAAHSIHNLLDARRQFKDAVTQAGT